MPDMLDPSRGTPRPRAFYEEMYPLPVRIASEDEWRRWVHHDLVEMDDRAVRLDRDRLRHRLMHDPKPHPWLLERQEAIQRRLGGV